MAITLNETFEGGANGVALATGITIFDGFAGTGTSTFSTTVARTGTRSGAFACTAAQFRHGTLTRTTAAIRSCSFYFRWSALPTNTTVMFYVGTSSATRTYQVAQNPNGTLKVQNSTAVAQGGDTTSAAVAGTLARLDVSCSSGNLVFEFYPNATMDAAIHTAIAGDTKTGTAGSSNTAFFQLGITNAPGNTVTLYIDDFREADTVDPPGSSAGALPQVSAGPDLTKEAGSASFPITATATPDPPKTITTHNWAQISGPTVGLSGGTTATVTVTPPATTGTAVLRYTATDSLGLSASDDVSIVFIPAGQSFRPVSDFAVNSWAGVPTVSPLAANIDEVVPDSSDYVESPNNPTGQEYKTRLTAQPAPSSTSNCLVEAQLWLSATPATQTTTVTLYDSDGVTVRKTFTAITDLTVTPTIRQLPLSSGEVAAITGWTSGLVLGVKSTLT